MERPFPNIGRWCYSKISCRYTRDGDKTTNVTTANKLVLLVIVTWMDEPVRITVRNIDKSPRDKLPGFQYKNISFIV